MSYYYSAVTRPIVLSSGTTVTMIQIEAPPNARVKVKEWSVSFDGTDSADSAVQVNTNYDSADITAEGGTLVGQPFQPCPVSRVSARINSGKTAASIATYGPSYFVTPIGGLFAIQYPLGEEPILDAGERFGLAVRVKDKTNGLANIRWEE
jgi:hypothetical protein